VTISDFLHAGPSTAELDATLPVAFVDAVPAIPVVAAASRAPSREAGPPGPAVALPLLL
jgi:hypothetical protein